MKVRFLGQPNHGQFGEHLAKLLDDGPIGKYTEFHLFSAFVKRSGVARLEGALRNFRSARGSKICSYVGIDHNGTSREGLGLLNDLSDETYVIHSTRADVTFHPKIFLLKGPNVCSALVGSTNLTAGGFFTNIEAAILLEDIDVDNELWLQFQEYLAYWKNTQHPFVVRLNARNLVPLLAFLPAEATARVTSAALQGAMQASFQPTSLSGIFGAGNFPTAPALAVSTAPARAASTVRTRNGTAATLPGISLSSILGFWKRVSNFDISRNSAPGQIQIPKGFAELFPPLGPNRSTPSGARQAEVNLAVRFIGLGRSDVLTSTRLIRYQPAAHHPRPNAEYRFTFLDRSINPDGLAAQDILVFERLNGDPQGCWFNVYHIPPVNPIYATINGLAANSYGALKPT